MQASRGAAKGSEGGADGGADFVREWAAMARDWRGDWASVIRAPALGSDLLAGLTVAAVALPLNVALAVASGLPPAVAGMTKFHTPTPLAAAEKMAAFAARTSSGVMAGPGATKGGR